jgi:uncharacterized protein (DUF427 family)
MSITLSSGPLSGAPADANFRIEGPAHRILFEPFPRRLRAELAGEVVIDTRRARLLHETGYLPQVYVPLEDVRADRLVASDHTSHCPFKGDATYRSLRVGDRTAENALWLYEAPIAGAEWLAGHAGVYQGRLDRWWDEDDEIVGGVRDPYHRVDVRASSIPVRVVAGSTLLAETARPLVVSETGVPNRLYLPREDVVAPLRPADTAAVCPYKGRASYWSVDGVENAAWSYEDPLDGCQRLRGHVAFDETRVQLVAGEAA